MIFLIYLIILFLPLYLIRFKLGFVPFNFPEVLICLLFILWLISILRKKEKIQPPPLIFFLPIFFIFLGLTISTWFSINLEISAGIWKGWFIVPWLFWLVVINLVKTPAQVKNALASLFLSGLGVALIALFYWLSGRLTYDGRLAGFYLSPNHLAMFLAPIFLLSFYLWSLAAKKNQKVILALSQALMLFIIFLTYSLGAWLGLLAGFIFLAIIYRKRFPNIFNKKFILFWLILLILFVLLVLFIQPHLSQKTAAFQSRLVIWQVAWEILKDSPRNFVFGIGPGLFQEYYLGFQERFPAYPEWAVPQPHNLFLAFWLQTGLIGLMGLVWLLVVFFRQNLKPPLSGIKAVLIITMIYVLFHGLIDTTYWKNDLAMIFWLMIGIAMIVSRINSSVKNE